MQDIAIGPVRSRRFGEIIDINLTPYSSKICSFDCPYCFLSRTELRMKDLKSIAFPTIDAIDISTRDCIRKCFDKNITINCMCVSGNGDPSLYPDLYAAFEVLEKIRFDMLPDKKLVIMSNGANLSDKSVVQAMNLFDERYIKVDAGSDETLKKINQPLVKFNTEALQAGTRKLKNFIAQSVFVSGAASNSNDGDIQDWAELIALLKPHKVQISTINKPAIVNSVSPLTSEKLHWIAQKVQRQLPCSIEVIE